MSVVAPARVPTTREEWLTSYPGGYARWVVQYRLCRHWTINWKTRSWECPGFVLCFYGGSDSAGNVPLVEAKLLWYTPLPYSAVDGVWYAHRLAAAVLGDVTERIDALPPGLRPQEVAVAVSAGEEERSTHTALGILPPSDDLLRAFEERAAALAHHGSSDATSPLPLRVISTDPSVPQHMVESAVQWCATHVMEERDATVECRPVPGWRRFLEALYRLADPIASTSAAAVERVLELAHSVLPPSTELLREDANVHPAVESAHRPSAFLATTLDGASVATLPRPSWAHVAVVQHNSNALRRTLNDDGIVWGPIQPATLFPVVHLHADAGDVEFAHKALMEDAVPVESYDSVLHSVDGEVTLSLGGVEGVSFDDLDVLLDWWAERVRSCPKALRIESPLSDSRSACRDEGSSRHATLLSNSCCPFVVVPHVARRVPTGIVARRTPFESPCMLVGNQDCSGEVADAALAALEWLLACVAPAAARTGGPSSIRVLRWTGPVPRPLQVADDALACSWCDRRRSKLPSCGACKTAVYCCKAHQALHWRGAHKKECAWMREGYARYDLEVRPLLCTDPSKNISSINNITREANAVQCTVTAFVKMLSSCILAESKPSAAGHREVVLHVVNFSGDTLRFLIELSHVTIFDRVFAAVAPHGVREVKMIVFVAASNATTDRHHCVYEVQRGRDSVRERQPTGVVGDYWRQGAETASNTPTYGVNDNDQSLSLRQQRQEEIVVVFSYEKYHNVVLPLDRDGTHSRDALPPDLVVVLGDSEGTGLTFFSGVAEVIAQKLAGTVPVVVTDASWVAAHRSLEAVTLRTHNTVESSGRLDLERAATALRKLKEEVRVELNVDGFNHAPSAVAHAHSRTPLHDHLYWWWLLPSVTAV